MADVVPMKKGAATSLRPCLRKGCPKFAHGVLTLNVPPMTVPIEANLHIRFIVGIEVCDDHLKDADPQRFMTPAWRTAVRKQLEIQKAAADPDFERAFLNLMPLDAPEYIAWCQDQLAKKAPDA